MKVRIPLNLISDSEIQKGELQVGHYSLVAPSKIGKTFWQFDNITPAQLDMWLDNQMGNHKGIKIDRKNWERFPFLQTF